MNIYIYIIKGDIDKSLIIVDNDVNVIKEYDNLVI